jgi:energy-coupling factor transport system ATP-binding protein
LRAAGLCVTYPGSSRWALGALDLELAPGECLVLAGRSGSGKSTLLRALAGVLPPGARCHGRVECRGRPALLFQNVETQLLFTTVEEEVASGLPAAAREAAHRSRRVAAALEDVGLSGFEARAVDALSAGEKQRTVLAALLAAEAAVLLLDEPTSGLDDRGRRRLAAVLTGLKRRGHALLVADHCVEPFREVADRRARLKEGELVPAPPPEAWAESFLPGPPPDLAHPQDVAVCERVRVSDAAGGALLRETSLRARRGERLLVTGHNGSGKTTLLRVLAGLTQASGGRVRVPAAPRRERPRGGVGLLFQNPQRNLFERTVAEEIAFGLRRLGWPRSSVRRRVEELLDLCDLAPHRDRSPLRLSFGEQHRVALASVLAPEPALLLLDEPFSGLDPEARGRLLDGVAREQARLGAAVVVASHDPRPLDAWCHACLRLSAEGPDHD